MSYARVHEYGFKGVVNVHAFMRQTINDPAVQVQPHARNVNMTIQDGSVDFSGDIKELFGQNQFAVAVGRGKVKLNIKESLLSTPSSFQQLTTYSVADQLKLLRQTLCL